MVVNGTYVLEKSENLESFLTGLGLKEEKVQKLCGIKPTMTLNLSGDKLDITSKGEEMVQNTLTLGAPSPYKLFSGFELEVNLIMSGNSGKGTLKKGDLTGEITLDFTDTGVTEAFTVGGHSCKRIYKRT